MPSIVSVFSPKTSSCTEVGSLFGKNTIRSHACIDTAVLTYRDSPIFCKVVLSDSWLPVDRTCNSPTMQATFKLRYCCWNIGSVYIFHIGSEACRSHSMGSDGSGLTSMRWVSIREASQSV